MSSSTNQQPTARFHYANSEVVPGAVSELSDNRDIQFVFQEQSDSSSRGGNRNDQGREVLHTTSAHNDLDSISVPADLDRNNYRSSSTTRRNQENNNLSGLGYEGT